MKQYIYLIYMISTFESKIVPGTQWFIRKQLLSALHHHLPLSALLPRPCMETDSYMLLRRCDVRSPTPASPHISYRVFHIGSSSYRLDTYKLASSYFPSLAVKSPNDFMSGYFSR